MIVVAGGMYRSGSTFSFNILRELLEVRGGVAVFSGNLLDITVLRNAHAANIVLKSHAPDELCTELIRLGALFCVCTYRKPEDAIASWMQAFGYGIEESLASMLQWVIWHRRVSKYALNINYEDVANAPLGVIEEIQLRIVGSADAPEANELCDKYNRRTLKAKYDQLQESDETTNIGISYYESTTFFHRRHITSLRDLVATELMTSETISRIRHELRDFIDGAGNYVL